LAEWEVSGNTTLYLYLEQGVWLEGGEYFTSFHVLQAWEQIPEPVRFEYVREMRAYDDYFLEIVTQQPIGDSVFNFLWSSFLFNTIP
jgi:hypothetical protein